MSNNLACRNCQTPCRISDICFGRDSPHWVRASSFTRFLSHTQRRTTVGSTPLDEWSARRRGFYLRTRNTQHTNIHHPSEIRTHNLSRRAAADLRLRPRSHWDRQIHLTQRAISGRVAIINQLPSIYSLKSLDSNQVHHNYGQNIISTRQPDRTMS